MQVKNAVHDAVGYIQKRALGFVPKVGLQLGSGLSAVTDKIEKAVRIPYGEIPGFPESTVDGHDGELVLGTMGGVPVACLAGRAHVYEGITPQTVNVLIRPLKALGCETLVLTNSSGSLRPEVGPGSLVLITDHMNFSGNNPLVGQNDNDFGPRFFPMDNAYDAELRAKFLETAKEQHILLEEGVYIGVMGPNFETPAEIRAFKILGADVIGMSTVPDVLSAVHCGLRVAVVATITNLACGLSDEVLTHEGTLKHAGEAADKLVCLLTNFIEKIEC